MNPYLTTRMRNLILKIKNSEEREIVRADKGGWWVDNDKVFAPDAYALLRYCFLRREGMSRDDFERFHLSPDALEMLEDDKRVPDIVLSLSPSVAKKS